MTAIKVLQMTPADRFTDEFGGVFPNAVIVLNKLVVDSREELDANFKTFTYDDNGGELSGLAYSVSYWYERRFMPTQNQENPQEKPLRKRPNVNGDYAFSVDVDNYSDIYQSAPGDHKAKCLAVCDKHFREEVLPMLSE